MKTLIKLFICSFSLLYPYYGYCETDSFLDNEESSEFVETSKESDDKEIKKIENEGKKSKTEEKKYQYDIEIYPYVSVKYTSTTVKDI